MISDLALVDIVAELYDSTAGDTTDAGAGWDHLLLPADDDGICAALRRIGDDDIVVFRGSETIEDWARDFLAIPHALGSHPQLGDVHAGFALGMDEAFAKLLPLLRASVHVTGHSLGAARATLFCGLLTAQNKAPVARVVFGEPRSGCASLTALLAGVPGRSYRNAGAGRHDLVTDVPTAPPFGRVTPLTDICALPPADDPWGLLSYHHIQLYQAGVAAMTAAAAA